jgi:RNA polymerase sigma factor for flagellar operon FliA
MDEEQFEAYASHRVQGAILDYLRSLDPLTRKLRGASRRISEVTAELASRLGRAPDEEEIAGELGLPLDTYHQMLMQIAEAGLARLELTDDSGWLAEQASPEALATEHELTDQVAAAIDELPERLRTVLGLYYQEECSFREIGAILGVTESRACQLHTEAVHRIRGRIKGKPLNSPPRAVQSA